MDYLETSAKTGVKINEAFEKLADIIINNRTEEELIREFGVKSKSRGQTLTKKKVTREEKKGCCK